METEKQYQKGKLYQYDGNEFVELEPSGDTKLPVSPEAAEAVKAVRKSAQKCIGMRPELSLTASSMLLVAANLPDIAEHVRAYGQRVYGGSDKSVTAVAIEMEPPIVPASQDASQQGQQSAGKLAAAYLD